MPLALYCICVVRPPPGLEITTGQRTMFGQRLALFGRILGWPVIVVQHWTVGQKANLFLFTIEDKVKNLRHCLFSSFRLYG